MPDKNEFIRDDNQGGTYHPFSKQYTFVGTLFSPSSDDDEHKTMQTTTTTNFSTVTIGEYKYIANVTLSKISSNRWRLSTDLFYIGPQMSDLQLNYSAYISTNIGNGGTKYFTRDYATYDQPGVKYLGNITYEFAGNSILGNFTLNIHGGAIIQNWWGATAPLVGAKYNVPVPILKY